MFPINEMKKCTGCQACRAICPTQCITMTSDEEGFLIPVANSTQCNTCNLCASRCPEVNRAHICGKKPIKVIGARCKDNAMLLKSASGGVFAALAAGILETPGNAVFGCAFDKDIVARHVSITDINDIEPLQDSKYVQSDVCNTYREAKYFLENGATVFYTGTPCQIAGLYAFLGRDFDNLLTADLICHGVPSPLLFKKYISGLSKRLGGKVNYYKFRSKEKYGWGYSPMARTDTKTRTTIADIDPFYIGFLENTTLRECCYDCKYANVHRVADITLGDFWGVDSVHLSFYDNRGVSLVLINTSKGAQYFEDAVANLEIIESSLDKIIEKQHNLRSPSMRPKERDAVYKDINNPAADVFKNAYFKPGLKQYIKACVKYIL